MRGKMDYGTHSYIGVAECGCARAMCRDTPRGQQFTAEDIKSFVDSGLKVEKMPNEEAFRRFLDDHCAKHPRGSLLGKTYSQALAL